LNRLALVSKKYGRGFIHISTRQEVEIPWLKLDDIDNVRKELSEIGIKSGACGPRVRNVISCCGDKYCRFGLLNCQDLAIEMDEEFFGKDNPKKFKISLAGCPNSCTKPQENDIGFLAAVEPVVNNEECTSCRLCVEVCPEGAITMGEDGYPRIDLEKCTFDGDCIAVCPTDAIKKAKVGYFVYVGGKIGRHPMLGYKLDEFVNGERAKELVRKSLDFYNKNGKSGERFGAMINRIGLSKIVEFFK
jgi:dissimilatory sulfite reductase (desulfoviridin) alpha/beta subunit